jgi:hypothetical protein
VDAAPGTPASDTSELRAAGDIESAEAEVYAARTSAEQRVATAEARLAEEIQRRRDAEAERAAARADREQADDAAAAAVTRMDELERELAETRIRADHQRSLDRLTTATKATITAIEETRDALRIRAERAETDLDAARTETTALPSNSPRHPAPTQTQPRPSPHLRTQVSPCPARGQPGC